MAKQLSIDDLKERLFAAADGGAACDAINDLAKLAKKGIEPAQSVLAAYVQDGAIPHMRAHACACLADSIRHPHAPFAELFRRGLTDAVIRYWSILGYINSAGKGACALLVELALDDAIRIEDRAHAIKCLARLSKQRFDRGLPRDPGFWEAKHLRLSELRTWADRGYPEGVEYTKPNQHPALATPQTEFERIVQKLEKRLAKQRKREQDPAEPTDWLVIADNQDISRIKARWNLPSTYLDFLTRFSPLRVNISNRKFYNPFWLYGASELLEGQDGYSYDPIAKQPISDWPAHLVVIASHGGDPYVLDLSRSDGCDAPILTAEHGAGEWKFEPVARSFGEFLEHLTK